MRRLLVIALLSCACGAAGTGPSTAEDCVAEATPPATRREPIVEVIHGTEVADPYRWLEQAGDAEVVAWTRAQDEHARSELAALPGRDALRERLRALMYFDAVSAPKRYGARTIYARRHADREKVIWYVREGEGDERVLLDPNRMSEDGSIAIGGVFPSPDGSVVAYRVSRNNADAATLHLLDLGSGIERIGERIPGARYAVPSWLPDGSGFYYTGLPTDPMIPPPELPGRAEVRFHRLGSDPVSDALVFPASHDPTTFVAAHASPDGHWLLLTISRGFDAQDVWFCDLRKPTEQRMFVPLAVGTGRRYAVVAHHDRFYVHTNDGAPRFRVMVVDPAHPEPTAWRELVGQRAATLQGVDVVGGALELLWLERASSRIELRTLEGAPIRELALPGIGTTGGLVGDAERDEAYFQFSSFTTPSQIFRTSIATGRTSLWHEVELPADTDRFEVEQVDYRSKDGTPISMFVVHQGDVVLDGKNPTLLTGYGGFGVSLTPTFSTAIVLWLEHGGVGDAQPARRR